MSKIYIVLQGHETGVYNNWNDCKEQVNGFKNAVYKSFKKADDIKKDSNVMFYQMYLGNTPIQKKQVTTLIENSTNELNKESIYVDGACSGNPGKGEYQLVYSDKKVIFRSDIYPNTTNNLMEFFALVDALVFNKSVDNKYFIYSDSVTAMAWVRNKKCNTKIKNNNNNKSSIDKISQCEDILHNMDNLDYSKILKWDTKKLGEIPADFGRK
jgi:ribonuclease HI